MDLVRRTAAIAALCAVLAVGCGGSDEQATGPNSDATVEQARSATPIVIATSTAPPAPTPLPTATPLPLKAPTPSAVLLTTTFTNDSKVTTVGIDEVFFGMTADEAAEAASAEWVGEPSATSNCYLVTPAAGPEGVVLWIVDGRVERVDVEHPDIRTPSQLGVGNTLDELQSQLGGGLTSATGDDGTVEAVFTPTDAGDDQFRLVFELVDDVVVRYRSGRVGIIDRPAADC